LSSGGLGPFGGTKPLKFLLSFLEGLFDDDDLILSTNIIKNNIIINMIRIFKKKLDKKKLEKI